MKIATVGILVLITISLKEKLDLNPSIYSFIYLLLNLGENQSKVEYMSIHVDPVNHHHTLA